MSTFTKNGTVVSYAYCVNSSWHGYTSGGSGAYAGAYNDGGYYSYCMKFKTPDFAGLSKKLTITFAAQRPNNFSFTSSKLRWALCTSDSNKSKYVDTYSAVSDSNQIKSGTVSLSSVSSSYSTYSVTVESSALKSDTTYYFFLWSNSAKTTATVVTVGTIDKHSIKLEYQAGIVYIDNGSSLEMYLVYIDNGSSWDLYIPYIDNGSSWDICT
jgi:hypothetical protein